MLNPIRGLALGLIASVALASASPAQAPVPPAVTGAASSEATPQVAAKPADIEHAAPTPGIGQPTQAITLESQETEIGQEAARFHDYILVPMMAIISAFVLLLLIWVVVRYRAAANPVPSKTHHNTLIEIIWTLAPVLILVCIAVPSIRLLAHQYSSPKADVTVKVIGNQWYWTYQYPDNGDFEVVSNMLKEKPGSGVNGRQTATGKERARTDADGPALLAVDERMVIPAGAVVKIITTSNDVIHSFSLPSAWTKMDAIPGRLNETWFKIDRPGVYFGQCSELCGARHAYMPIAVEVVSKEKFAQWVAFKGGTMPGAKPAEPVAAAAPAAPVATDTPVAGTGATPPVTSQPAVAQN